MKSRFLIILAAVFAAFSARAQDWAKARLDNSPRHLEWVTITHDKRAVQSYIAYPEVKEKATAVIVIHEIFGMSDWVRGVTDQLAEAGYIAIAPDLLSGMGPNGGGTDSLDSKAVGKAINALPPEQISADLNALVDYVSKLPSCNGKVIVAGFCWGGGQSFRFATNNHDLKAALVFYGVPPTTDEAAARIACPVYGFYAGNDARVSATIPAATELMKKAGKTYEPVVYDGAGHGFMRAGEGPPPTAPKATGDADADQKAQAAFEKAGPAYVANKKARDAAWQRWLEILKKI
jgi:carboxymethylenebutenolidase